MTNKHLSSDLAQMQSLPLEAKIIMTKERIRVWYESWTRFEIYNKKTKETRFVTIDTRDSFAEPSLKDTECIISSLPGQVYVSFSGGKDSTVLKHIVDSMYDDVPALFVNTGLEYPEIQRFVKDIKLGKYNCFNSNVEILRPEMRFDEVLKKYGYPVASKELSRKIYYGKRGSSWAKKFVDGTAEFNGKPSRYAISKRFIPLMDAPFEVSPFCCDVMKKKPAKQYEKASSRKPFIGVLADESEVRKQAWIRTGCNSFEGKKPQSKPLSFWTEQDILHYIKKYNVPYCSVYGDIVAEDSDGYYYEMPIEYSEMLYECDSRPKLTTTGYDRTGCMFCMFGCHLEKEPNRFQKLKETHPRQYAYCINGGEMVDGKWQPNKEGLGIGKVLDYIGVDYD